MAKPKIIGDLETRKIGECADAVLRTEEGRALWAYLYRYCGFHQTSLVYDKSTGGIELVTSALNEARRGVYIHLRGIGSRDLVAKAEEIAEAPVAEKIQEEEEK